MAYITDLDTFSDSRGSLTVIEKVLPYEIKRVYYVYNVSEKRGGHRHIKTIQALIALNGHCEIFVDDGLSEETFILDSPSKCLIVEPKDWHTMDNFSNATVLLVLSSEYYDENDYIVERY
ncbi:WxcM domain protein [Arcobacter nitrofigilis DSM 7299]|uniref:WxcM domain protein n=1 Tax=Arcobacter nitrofigilis (strain ATCC 33309 / DSM 7299 / CCUG 15893 / LMG 7604 / NCTC 12251 / CI) TaxID=572480 RepID=D5V6D2_ARCNC|nr:FdtA/QdtA family cupin domain-containing protein [Arcobacter nitrofigilis]ADG94202.1 WxcM domain protein [Arcobacter nitrofigilis DSM 7299]